MKAEVFPKPSFLFCFVVCITHHLHVHRCHSDCCHQLVALPVLFTSLKALCFHTSPQIQTWHWQDRRQMALRAVKAWPQCEFTVYSWRVKIISLLICLVNELAAAHIVQQHRKQVCIICPSIYFLLLVQFRGGGAGQVASLSQGCHRDTCNHSCSQALWVLKHFECSEE